MTNGFAPAQESANGIMPTPAWPLLIMATEAAKLLIAQKNIDPAEIELIVIASVTPDMFFPATACLVQDRIGAKNAWGFDLSAACSGFLTRSPLARNLLLPARTKKR